MLLALIVKVDPGLYPLAALLIASSSAYLSPPWPFSARENSYRFAILLLFYKLILILEI